MNELALFAGAGGGILGSYLLGWKTVCAVEIEDYPRRVLLQRQRDGILDRFPIWDDIRTFDGTVWNGRSDIVTGGFPCQDISAAGRGKGIDGERSGLWSEMFRVVCEVDAKLVYMENSPMLTIRGLYRVLSDLASVGYNARWCVLGADDVGAPHHRKRIWILAYSKRSGLQKLSKRYNKIEKISTERASSPFASCVTAKGIYRLPDSKNIRRGERIARRVDRIKSIGNGQVPSVAALAFIILSEGLI